MNQIDNYYMSDEDFEAFLIEIGGLKSGYRTDVPPITTRFYCEHGNGWLGLVKQLIIDLIANGWDKEICQVKEKFGTLRFYTNGTNDICDELISKAAKKSSEVCEVCGNPGKMRNQNGWYSTLCDKDSKN